MDATLCEGEISVESREGEIRNNVIEKLARAREKLCPPPSARLFVAPYLLCRYSICHLVALSRLPTDFHRIRYLSLRSCTTRDIVASNHYHAYFISLDVIDGIKKNK